MVPGLIRDRLEGYLTRHGLKARDVPGVLAMFTAAKYSTWFVFVGAGVRFRPLSRLIQRHYPALRQRVLRELETTKHGHTTYAETLRQTMQIFRQQRRKVVEISQLAHDRVQLHRVQASGFRERLVTWYLSAADKYIHKFASYSFWKFISRAAAQDPQHLAVGIVEGSIFFKVTYLLHAPLELYFVIRYFQTRHTSASADATQAGTHDMAEIQEVAKILQDQL